MQPDFLDVPSPITSLYEEVKEEEALKKQSASYNP